MNRRPIPSRRAFTLPEVLASLVLVGLVLPAVLRGVSLAMSASDDARKRVEAVGLAESKLAELSASVTGSGGQATSGDFGAEWPLYRWDASTASVDTDLTEIRVRVTWPSRGAERSVDLATYAYTGQGAQTTGGTTTTPPPAGGSTP